MAKRVLVKEAGEHLSQEQWPEPKVHVTKASGRLKRLASRDSDAQSASLAHRCRDLAILTVCSSECKVISLTSVCTVLLVHDFVYEGVIIR